MSFPKMLLTLILLGVMPMFVNAAPIPFTGVSATGTYSNNLDLLTDGTFPAEGSHWQSDSTVYFNQWSEAYDREYFVFDMGSFFLIDDMSISVDNNDSYTIEYSTDQSNWLGLTVVDLGFGEVSGGMDTMTSISGESEYISGLDFAQSGPGQYLRIYVDGWQYDGSGDGAYSLGEFQVFGEAYVAPPEAPAPVPEPSTLLLLGAGLGGLMVYRRKAKK